MGEITPEKKIGFHVNHIMSGWRQAADKTIAAWMELGGRIKQAKESLTHGEWRQMFEHESFAISRTQADRFVRLHEHGPRLIETAHGVGGLPQDMAVLDGMIALDQQTLKTAVDAGKVCPTMGRSGLADIKRMAAEDLHVTPPTGEAAEPGPEPEPVPEDHEGREIPEKMQPAFDKGRSKLAQAIKLIGQARKLVEESDEDGEAAYLARKHIEDYLKSAASDIRAAMPYAVCACRGINKSCTKCKPTGRKKSFGWVSKDRWKSIPEDDR